jgi:H+/Cl- antiporter ClcA
MMEAEPWQVLVGGGIGLLGAFMAYIFALFHSANMKFFASLNLLDNRYAVYRALVGGFFVVLIGLLIPQTMFWGEDEFQVIANMLPASELPNIWPTTGLTGWEMDTPWKAFVTGMAKLLAISFTVAGGLRGGYIFPLMCSGAAFGRVLNHFVDDVIPLQVSVLCFACGMNVAITRTSLASTLILAFLPGEPCAIPAILMAALCSLFATAYLVRQASARSRNKLLSSSPLTYYFSLFSLSSRVKSHAVISTTASSTTSISLKTMHFSKKMMTNELSHHFPCLKFGSCLF